ncbi:hypothetical protein MNB_SUP05-SYMBIONT-5-47 [hydrothermal vent metagenome]|uniref:Uncharacterized protein n=1 Tax=hydrothermal vent metagenome TaxID=652676 RepID=A0A1W1E452_9ZZZZ
METSLGVREEVESHGLGGSGGNDTFIKSNAIRLLGVALMM